MASALGISKKRDPKEIIESQGGESKKGSPGETVKITGGVSGSGLYNPQQSGIARQNYNIMDNGRLVINPGVEEYKWNDRLKRYDAVPGMGRGYLLAESVGPQEQAPVKPGSGKSRSAQPSAPAEQPGYIEERAGSPGLTTEQMMGNTYNQMMDWRPTASNGAGGVQKMNPLADPNKFIYQADPAQQQTRAIGRYVNPNIQPEGLLVATPNFKKSKNPYSLLG
jgi:hypothetical protein